MHSGRPGTTNDYRTVANLGAIISMLTIPTVVLWAWEGRRHPWQKSDFSTLAWAYITTGTLGMVLVIVLQGVFAYPLALLLFRSDAKEYIKEFTTSEDKIKDAAHRQRRMAMSRRWQYWAFLFIFAFIMAGVLEEGLKYCAIMLACRHGKVATDRDYITVPIAAAVGFATVEVAATAYGTSKNNASPKKLLTIVERTVFGIPGHAMTAALIGVNVLARDTRSEPLTAWQVLRPSVLFHGCSDFILFAISAYNGNVGWVHPQGRTETCFTIGWVVGIQLVLASVLRGKLYQYGIVL